MTQNSTIDLQQNNQKAKRKLVNELCANCGTGLEGQFCHECGQSSKSMIKFFGAVIKELLDDAFGYDSRFKHSLAPLLLKPGRLSLDYVKGKRFHYVLPFRLYLITSVLFILLIKNTAPSDAIDFDNQNKQASPQEDISKQIIEEVSTDILKEVNQSNPSEKDKPSLIKRESSEPALKMITEQKDTKKENETTKQSKGTTITVGDGSEEFNLKWNNETKRLDGVDEIGNPIFKNFFSTINPKLADWMDDPEPLFESIIESLPYMMFVILPIFAIFLKLFYLFSKRFYTEHLVFLLHNHSFIYMLMMIQIILDMGEDGLKENEHWAAQAASSSFQFVSTVLMFWMIAYVFLAMKRFYQQGWWGTIGKTFMLSFVYFVLLTTGFVFTIGYGAYQA